MLLLVVLLAAAEPAPWADAEAYCRYTSAAAASEGSLLLSPSLFGTLGVLDVSDVSPTGVPGSSSAARVTAGLSYSGQRIFLGLLGERRAAADCALYRATSQLRTLLFYGEDELEREALEARAAVLAEMLPEAAAILAREVRAVESGRSTAEALTATQLRVDALTALATVNRERLAALPQVSPHRAVADLIALRNQAALAAELLEEEVRRTRAFDLTVRAGLDRQLSGPTRSPLFGLVTLTFNPGWFFQGSKESQARAAYAEWVPTEAGGLSPRAEQLLVRLRAVLRGEEQRLGEAKALEADLVQRRDSLLSIAGDKVERFRDYLWLEGARLAAERAYLAVHVRSLRAAIREEPR